MHIGMVSFFDPAAVVGGYSFSRILALLDERVEQIPALRRRLQSVPFGLHHPLWVEDDDFDIQQHVHRVKLAAPGGPAELGTLIGNLHTHRLNRHRPLWHFWVIEGLASGEVALFGKMHHAAADGVAGARLMMTLFDPEAKLPKMGPRAKLFAVDDDGPAPTPAPDPMDLIRAGVRERLRSVPRLARLLGTSARNYLQLQRSRASDAPAERGPRLASPSTSFNRAVSSRRHFAMVRLPLAELNHVKNRTGATLNDVLLTVCAGALRDYLEARGALPDTPLVATCPVSVRKESATGAVNNQISFLRTSLHTDVEQAEPRLEAIRQRTVRAKRDHKKMGKTTVKDWAEYGGPRLLGAVARLYGQFGAEHMPPSCNLCISNVPGPRNHLSIGGAPLRAVFPMGPVLDGLGVNITVMSYHEALDIGINVDPELFAEPWELADRIERAFAALERDTHGIGEPDSEVARMPALPERGDRSLPQVG